MVVGISFLAQPLWNIFYGFDSLSISIFRIFIFEALSYSFFTVLINLMQTLNNTKVALITLFLSFIGKVVLNIPVMNLCKIVDIPLYLGPIIVTLITQLFAIIYVIYVLRKHYQVRLKETLKIYIKIILATIVMLLVLIVLEKFISLNITNRLLSILYIGLYAVVGVIIYGLIMVKTNTLEQVLGGNFINDILVKLHLKRK